jgi:hypothetical protein
MDLFCDEPVSALLEVPDAQRNTLDTPDELLEAHDPAAESNLGALPLHNDEDHALRLHVLLELEDRQLTSDYLQRQPYFDTTHRFAIVQWLHVVRPPPRPLVLCAVCICVGACADAHARRFVRCLIRGADGLEATHQHFQVHTHCVSMYAAAHARLNADVLHA